MYKAMNTVAAHDEEKKDLLRDVVVVMVGKKLVCVSWRRRIRGAIE
jgi:hypothetical protein